ncbi:MAG: protein kinase [Pseudomonadota bacterium]
MKIDSLIGRIIHNRFRLEERLGVGGMGAVYRAKHLFLDRVAAIKIIRPEQKSQDHFRAWFLREARAVNMINHAHIVEIYDYGETEDGLAYLVMEFLDGMPLTRFITNGPMGLRESVDLLEQVCAALARAHDMGVIHRDLKPDNIFLLERGGRKNFIKILDFGLARVIKEGRLAEEGSVFGTPEYISPEQARGEDAVPASDLYAVGVVFFEMLTGRLPFETKDRDKLFGMHIYKQPPTPSSYRKNISPTAEGIIMKLLAKVPEERFADAHHLLEEIKNLQRILPRDAPEENVVAHQRMSFQPSGAGGRMAALPEFAQWAIKSTIFARMVARAFPAGQPPTDITRALDGIWKTTAEAARVDGEISAGARRLEGAEKKFLDFKAQIGRKVEELSREISKLSRSIQMGQEELETKRRQAHDLEDQLASLRRKIDEMEQAGADSDVLKRGYEQAGSLHANFIVVKQAVHGMESKIIRDMENQKQLEERIDSYKSDLEGQIGGLEVDIQKARANVEQKGVHGAKLRKQLIEGASFLVEQLYPNDECRDLFVELEEFSQA